MDIGKKIKELRLSNDLTLEELASRSELTKGFLSQVERNLTSPSISTLEDILEALGNRSFAFFPSGTGKEDRLPHGGFLRGRAGGLQDRMDRSQRAEK